MVCIHSNTLLFVSRQISPEYHPLIQTAMSVCGKPIIYATYKIYSNINNNKVL